MLKLSCDIVPRFPKDSVQHLKRAYMGQKMGNYSPFSNISILSHGINLLYFFSSEMFQVISLTVTLNTQ